MTNRKNPMDSESWWMGCELGGFPKKKQILMNGLRVLLPAPNSENGLVRIPINGLNLKRNILMRSKTIPNSWISSWKERKKEK